MRVLIAGSGPDGRSCAVRDREVRFEQVVPGLAGSRLFATKENPPPARPPGSSEFVDLGVAPGLCGWVLWRFDPDTEYPMHYTDTLDFVVILEGSIELILDDGAHRLSPGDCVVNKGVDHAWRAGPEGCVSSAVGLGTPPPK